MYGPSTPCPFKARRGQGLPGPQKRSDYPGFSGSQIKGVGSAASALSPVRAQAELKSRPGREGPERWQQACLPYSPVWPSARPLGPDEPLTHQLFPPESSRERSQGPGGGGGVGSCGKAEMEKLPLITESSITPTVFPSQPPAAFWNPSHTQESICKQQLLHPQQTLLPSQDQP